jgi:SARP family transcriptional regulator, regulator of embCAB operon
MRRSPCRYLGRSLAGTGTTNIQLCGRFASEIDGRRLESQLPLGQGRLLFAFLVINRGRRVDRDELIEAIWPDALPATPELSLSALLSKLRKVLGPGTLDGRSELRLVLPADTWIDVEAAIEAIHRAESAIVGRDWQAAFAPAGIARAIACRELMPGEQAPWIDELRRSLDDVRARALECEARVSLGIGGAELPIAARTARKLVELHPERESGHRLLMEALERTGDPAEALRVYERLRRMLREELGSSPSAATMAAHRRLLRDGPAAPGA